MTVRLRLPASILACVFDMDGVLTRTAELHALAWKRTFDALLRRRAAGRPWAPFDAAADYAAYVDGRPRADGVRTFLKARGLELPDGRPSDAPSLDTIEGVAARKNAAVQDLLAERGVAAYEGSVRFLHAAAERRLRVALVTSSENAPAVLRAAGLQDAFDVLVDGAVARELHLPGKPAPDTFLEAARRLSVPASRTAVFEDALAGVAAGRAGEFGLVVGIDRTGHAADLQAAGADVVVGDLSELIEAQ